MGLRPTLRRVYRPVRRHAQRALSRLRGGRGVRVRLASDWIVSVSPGGFEDLRYWAEYEAATVQLLQRVWRSGMQLLDVGAHHGLFSLCCCPPHALPSRVATVEPSPTAQPLLRANRAVHPALDWTIVPAAVGAAPGTLLLYPGFIHMLVSDPSLHPGSSAEAAVAVPLTTMDAICADLNLRPDLVKIDVEGYEAEALRGAVSTLRQGPAIVLEWHCATLRQRGLDPLAALQPLVATGYQCEPYEHPELGTIAAAELGTLPPRDLYRLYCDHA